MDISTDSLKFWNSRALTYEIIEASNFQSGLSLYRMLRMNQAKSILEMGCGGGMLSLYLLKILPDGIEYISGDFSDEMIKVAEKRKEEEKNKFNKIDHSFHVIDACDLSKFKDESFEVYMGNLFFQLVPDEVKTLKEAHRVLKSGGKLGLSVIGNREKSTYFTVWQDVVMKYDTQGFMPKQDPKYSPFRFGDREFFIKLIEENGFEVEFCWNETDFFPYNTDEQFLEFINNGAKVINKFDEETQKIIRDEILEGFHKLKDSYTPIQKDVVCVIAKKK